MAGSRAGLEFFQSLLDSHEEVLQLPGILYIDANLIKILSIKSKESLAKEFINQYPNFFDSRKSDIERHYMLGSNKKKFYKVEKNKFVKNFLKLSKKKRKFKNHLFDNLYLIHKAYNFKSINKSEKIFIVNAHILPYVLNFDFYFKNVNYDIIHTIRHPLSSISSATKNWIKYKNGYFFTPKELYYNLELIFFGIKNLLKLKKKIYIIQLENLHQNLHSVMREFCKIYKIKFSSSLKRSTFHNLKWWGDKISGKDLNGVNKNFKVSYDLNIFFERDINLINNIFQNKFKKYKYKKISTSSFSHHLFPLKCEYITWLNTFKNFRFKHILLIPYYYFKRIWNLNLSLSKDIKLPKSLGAGTKEFIE